VKLDDISRIKIIAGVDAIVAIFLFIVGILVTILGFGYMDTMNQSSSYSSIPFWTWTMPWIIVMLGITTIIYGIKRLIDDILRTMIKRNV
jgi:uncharacterized integral membrane protein